jgi:hypothetical protein
VSAHPLFLVESFSAHAEGRCAQHHTRYLARTIKSPFRAHWRNYEDDHLQIVVDCHFHIRPTGDEYWDNRQRVLEAIYEAATKTGVHFEIRTDG